jgi:hypothetical protein
VTSAGFIWKRGEYYEFDASRGQAPLCWVPTNNAAAAGFVAEAAPTAERSIPGVFQAGSASEIRIAANPPSSATSYAVEEKPPRGWTVSNISHDGTFDPETGVIRWGVFFDATPRTLTYTLTAPAGVASLGSFNGEFSFDGNVLEVQSASITVASPKAIEITDIRVGSSGVTLNISGPAGQTAVIESSPDFVNWTEAQSIFIPDGEVGFSTEISGGPLFYRLRVR